MKKYYPIKIMLFFIAGFFLTITFGGCKKFLKEKVFTEYAPDVVISTESGINSILVSAYSRISLLTVMQRDYIYAMNEFPTDEMDNAFGGFYATAVQFMQFKWDASSTIFSGIYTRMYQAVRNANLILDNVDNIAGIPADRRAIIKAEAKFIRAAAYTELYYSFGPTPLITSAATVDLQPERATDDEMKAFIINEFSEAAANLPVKQAEYGRATKGGAMAMLCKFYLNTKQWQQASLMADQIIGLNVYKLFPDITTLFAVQNNHNSEYIYYSPCASSPVGYGNLIMAHCFPPNYPIQSNWINYATDFHIFSWLVNSYDPGDKRLKLILTSYVDNSGKTVQLNKDANGNSLNLSAPFKYTPDPNSSAEHHGNYIPIIRYADILLSKAEALNNINGPNSVSFDLIDSVRLRSGISPINRSAYATKDQLNTQLLQERAWEFVGEGMRRMDMIRMGKFISSAQGRGLNAQSYMTLYPIPQSEIQNNPKLKQNAGYPQ